MLEKDCKFGYEIDKWAIGIILYRLLENKPPFSDLDSIKRGDYSISEQTFDRITEEQLKFMTSLL